MDLLLLLFQWIVVFLINIIPAFAPPTWIVLSYFYITTPQNIFLLVLLGVTASTAGRYSLAWLSSKVFKKFASEKKKDEAELLRARLNKKPLARFLFSFIFAIGPLPSNALFIAVGSTKVKLKEVILGFFFGRLISYLFLVYTSEKIFTSFGQTLLGEATIYTLWVEVLGILVVLLFFLLDWTKLMDFVDGCLSRFDKKNPPKKRFAV